MPYVNEPIVQAINWKKEWQEEFWAFGEKFFKKGYLSKKKSEKEAFLTDFWSKTGHLSIDFEKLRGFCAVWPFYFC